MSMNQTVRQSMAGSDRVRETNLSVANGMEAVSLGLSDQAQAIREGRTTYSSQHVAMSPDEAVELAVALLNAAWNVRNGIHGSSAGAKYDDRSRAIVAFNETNFNR